MDTAASAAGVEPFTWINTHLVVIAVVVFGVWLAGIIWGRVKQAVRRLRRRR